MFSPEYNKKVCEFITTVRILAQRDTVYAGASRKTIAKLRLLLQERLANKNLRKAILAAIVGFPVMHQSVIPQHTHSVLIDLIKEGEFDDAIRNIESQCAKCLEADPFGPTNHLYSPEWLSRCMPDLSDANQGNAEC